MSRLRQLGKDSLIYGLGAILAKSLGFFLLPVYTRIFSPSDYGTIEMLTVIANLLAAVLVMGMDSAQSFYFFEQKKRGKSEQARVVSAILQWRLTWGAVIVAVSTFAAPLLSNTFFNGKLAWEYFGVAFVSVFFAQLMTQSVEIFRLLYRPWPYITIMIIQSLGAAALILLLVLVFKQGVFGYFLGGLLASVFVAGLGWYLVRDYLDFSRLQTDWWPRLLRFGVPLLPAGLAMYVMTTSDRWFIQHYHGEFMLGLYAVAAKFSLIMALAIETFRKAWWPIAMDAMHSEDGPETYKMISRLFMGLGVASLVYLTFLSQWLVAWLTAPDFHDSWPLVGVLSWQALFYGFYLVAAAGIWKAEKTRYSMYLTGGAAILNIALNWILVPPYGAMGAALATALSYLLWIMGSLLVSERLWTVGFPKSVLTIQIALGVATVAWLILVGATTWVSVLGIHVVLVLLLILSLNGHDWSVLKRRIIRHA